MVITMEVKLEVDGQEVDLNEFVSKIIGGMVAGAVGTLRGIPEKWGKIEITVER